VVTLGKSKNVFVGNPRRMSSNPNNIMTSPLKCVHSELGEILVKEQAQGI